ncbi:MAG: IPT/TIG domain-containing protein [Deltaproteobacteria bacterium]|nr:IPT/TIG domain-containing protein [Deltaproteobacteria bacterium]
MRAWSIAAILAIALAACSTSPSPGGATDAPRGDARVVDGGGTPDATPTFSVQYTDPDHGPFRGGTTTVIRGTGFAKDDVVRIGGRLATEVVLLDARHLQVTVPPGEPGVAAIEVTAPGGAVASRDDAFTYEAIAIDPPSGSIAGGTYVIISGFGTHFDDAPVAVLFDGLPATGVTVENAERLTAFTPPGTTGDANVLVATASDTYRADRGYAYYATGDPFAGGLSGGAINGTVNVVVIDAYTQDGVAGAFVALGDPNTTPWRGNADALGQITFSGPTLKGPISVVATAPGYEVGTFDCFDATNLSITLRPQVSPTPTGPPGVGTSDGTIRGNLLFGNATGLGSAVWNIVPEPRTATEVKRIYVGTSGTSVFGQPRQSIVHIDYSYDPNQLAWPFEINARPGAWSVVAVAGLYDAANDPKGDGSQGFEPFALGVGRGVLVGPDEVREGIDVVVDIPLDAAVQVQLKDPPPLATPGFAGPMQHLVRAVVDLGGEGTILFGAHGLPPGASGDLPGTITLPTGVTSLLLTSAPSLTHAIGDASYAFLVGAYTYLGAPMSARLVRGVKDTSHPVSVSGFLGVPRAADPAPEGVASSPRHAVIAPEHETSAPTFHIHYLSDDQGMPIWRAITCGAEIDTPLPDLSSIGVVFPPPDKRLYWTVWSIQVPGDFNQYTYRWNGSSYWTAYASDSAWVTFPAQ